MTGNKEPLYQQIVEALLEQIRDGRLEPGARVPSQNELAKMYGVSEITSRRALRELEERGAVRRIRGKGTFVSVQPKPGRVRGHIGFVLQHPLDVNEQVYNPYFMAALRGAAAAAALHGYKVTFQTVDAGQGLLDAGHFDAWILGGTLHRPAVEALVKKRKPVVTLTSYFPDLDAPVVSFDNVAGGFLATSHLIELGHEDIAIVCPDQDSRREFGGRLRGYQLAMEQHELQVGEGSFAHSLTTEAAGCEAAYALLRKRRPTAIVAATDTIALGVLKAASRLGLRVPEDLSVVGYDDQPFASHVAPALTTVRQDGHEVGRRALEALKDMLDGQPPSQLRIELRPKLVVRESTRAVRAFI